jgi:hypothetical protein
MDELELYFKEEACPCFKGDVEISLLKWSNGLVIYPRNKYKVTNEFGSLTCDVFTNEFSKSNNFLTNKDVHSFKIKRYISTDYNHSLKITGKSFWWKLWNRQKFYIETSDATLKSFLLSNASFKELFESYHDPEFFPEIKGKFKDGKYQLIVKFCLARFNKELLKIICEALVDLDKKIKDSSK